MCVIFQWYTWKHSIVAGTGSVLTGLTAAAVCVYVTVLQISVFGRPR